MQQGGGIESIVEDVRRFYEPQPEPPRDAFGFFLWYVLGQRATPMRRDAAMAALKRIPALTPDAVWKAPRAKLHAAVAHAGPPEERLHAVMSGVEIFRHHRDIDQRLHGALRDARRATRLLGPLDPVGAQWMLLVAGDHPVVPRHAGVGRLMLRLGLASRPIDDGPLPHVAIVRDLAAAAPRDARFLRTAMQYLVYHVAVTCTLTEPHCRVCPLASGCAYAQAIAL